MIWNFISRPNILDPRFVLQRALALSFSVVSLSQGLEWYPMRHALQILNQSAFVNRYESHVLSLFYFRVDLDYDSHVKFCRLVPGLEGLEWYHRGHESNDLVNHFYT